MSRGGRGVAAAYTELTPSDLLSSGFAAPKVTDRPWLVRWDRAGAEIGRLVLESLPTTIDFHTSGTTGVARCWRRTREQLWAEAGLLADLLAPDRPEAVLSFAPPQHVYGALATVLVPARLRLPAWYRPQYFGAMPPVGYGRWGIVAVPWTFSILGRQSSWLAASTRLSIMHSSATLPAAAATFVEQFGTDRAGIVEVFGSTEAGGVATRRWSPGNPPWTLFDDVEYDTVPDPRGEVPLVIRSPRLAFRPGQPRPGTWRMDDYVEPLDTRRFRFSGRRERLVKVNGRRLDLDELEDSLRSVLRCADLALLPVRDVQIGEHFDLLVVPGPDHALTDLDLHAALVRLKARPRRTYMVGRIDRSATGKLRRIQQQIDVDGGADS